MWDPKYLDKEFLEIMQGGLFIAGTHPHPDPRLYKYNWWVFHSGIDEADASEVFWNERYRMCEKDHRDLIQTLTEKKAGYFVANDRQYRLGTTLWDYDRLKIGDPDIRFAPAFDDDPDPMINGRR